MKMSLEHEKNLTSQTAQDKDSVKALFSQCAPRGRHRAGASVSWLGFKYDCTVIRIFPAL